MALTPDPRACPRCQEVKPHKHYSGEHVSYAHDPLDVKAVETEIRIENVKNRLIAAHGMGVDVIH